MGWGLNYGGGIISRTMRGSEPDEYPNGIANNAIPTDPTALLAYRRKVNTSKIDGETDIFSLNVNGLSAQFVIKKSGSTYIAVPLDKTPLNINCQFLNGRINGWIVIDQAGNKYVFEASNPSNAFLTAEVPTTSFSRNVITTWYLRSAELMNNGTVQMEYHDGESAEYYNQFSESFIKYGTPLQLPTMESDPQLNDQLRALQSNLEINKPRFERLLEELNSLHHLRDQSLQALNEEARDTVSIRQSFNAMSFENYNNMIKLKSGDVPPIAWEIESSTSMIGNILTQKFYGNTPRYKDFRSNGQRNVMLNKLVKRIVLRSNVFEFNYRVLPGFSGYGVTVFDNIKFRTIAGDLLKTAYFTYDGLGFLKRVLIVSGDQSVEADYSCEYFNEGQDLNFFSKDYWGFFNGRENTCLFPADPYYIIPKPGGGNNWITVFSELSGNVLDAGYLLDMDTSFGGAANRKPDGTKSKAHSLKSVQNHWGEKITFDYEGNTMYAAEADANVSMGGIRIKSIIRDPGVGLPVTVNYKYEFPLSSNNAIIRSTGRLTEWHNKSFAWKYSYGVGLRTRMYMCLPIL